jgi:hypothetical protein
MFKRYQLISGLLLLLFTFGAYLLYGRVENKDRLAYAELLSESATLRTRRSLENHPATQWREGVAKDFYIPKNGERLHLHLFSDHSKLTVFQTGRTVAAIEELTGLSCSFQEELDRASNLQQIRTLQAASGTYTFPSHRFYAQAVNLAFYRVPGHLLPPELSPSDAFLRGTASEVTFSAAGPPLITAQHLKAELEPEKGVP